MGDRIRIMTALALLASGAAVAAPEAQKLPISIADLMRASVEVSSAGIFALQYEEKIADPDWLLIHQDATNLAAAATLMLIPGAGTKDAQWQANADWRGWTAAMQKASLDIRAAAGVKDLARLGTAGDALAETCTACHAKYRPEKPSDGISRYPFYPKRQRASTSG